MNAPIGVAIVEDTPETLSRFTTVVTEQAPLLSLLYTSSTGQDMLNWLDTHVPDVLLVDLGLPDVSGLDVIRHCRKKSPVTDILVITLFGDEANMIAAFEAGATGYLLKDGSEDELAQHIQAVHAGGSPMSPMIARRLIGRFQPPVPSQASTLKPSLNTLTPREQTMLVHLSQGFSYQELAQLSGISTATVNTHVKNIYRKLEVHSKTEAVFEARQMGILPH